MARRVFDYTADLTEPVKVKSFGSVLSLSDDSADAIDIHLVSKGNPLYVYDGTVKGRVLRPDGKTYVFGSDNVIAQHYIITFPKEAYEVPGTITISAVYSKDEDYETTIMIMTAYVHKTISDDITDLDAE